MWKIETSRGLEQRGLTPNIWGEGKEEEDFIN